jgi:hypothetical protein
MAGPLSLGSLAAARQRGNRRGKIILPADWEEK